MQHLNFGNTTQVVLLIFTIGYTATIFAEIYKCTTPEGIVNYSNKPCSANTISEIIKLGKQPPSTGIASKSTPTHKTPYVDIYITSWCPYCKQAMAYLDKQSIYYHKYDIEKDASAAARKKPIKPGYSGVPLTSINGQIISGFSESSFERALKKGDPSNPPE